VPDLRVVETGLLVFARLSAFMFITPFFAIKGIPALAKAGLALLITMLIYPTIQMPTNLPDVLMPYFGLIIKEVLVGLILGYVSMLTFSSVRVAGEMIDLTMGFSMASLFDPQNQTRITLVGQFMYIVAILLFLAIDGHHSLLLAVQQSFNLVPLGTMIWQKSIPAFLLKTFIGMFLLGIRIAAPIIAVLLLCDICLGLIARTVPQLNVFIIGVPLKAGLGLIALAVALPVLVALIGQILHLIEKDLGIVLELLT